MIYLIGMKDSRRTEYFKKAAEDCHATVRFVDWSEAVETDFTGGVVKIDPPSYSTANLFEMNEQVALYCDRLHKLEEAECTFLNTPSGIETVLNKRYCKQVLQENGIAVTSMLEGEIHTVEQLEEVMDRHRVFDVFIKPIFCSGAAGVVAYRRFPGKGREAAYTSCCLREGELINTKTLYRLEKREEIQQLLQAVLSLGAVVERWHPKASFRGRSYDLRVVWQFGRRKFMVARQSKGPITNLHLNNAPLDWRELNLTEQTLNEIDRLCASAIELFPGLAMAGIDILLERGTLQPRIIEMNGQGDLMYQDIFHDNMIYRQQVQKMLQMEQDQLIYTDGQAR